MSAPPSAAPPAASSRGEIRRERLIDAAEAVFTRDGLRGASMERIAAEAGVARATVYAYFTDKEDAFVQVCQRPGRSASKPSSRPPCPPPGPNRFARAQRHPGETRTGLHNRPPVAARRRPAGRQGPPRRPIFAAEAARVLAALQSELEALGAADAHEATAILLTASDGIAGAAPSLPSLQSRLSRFVEAFLNGLKQPG